MKEQITDNKQPVLHLILGPTLCSVFGWRTHNVPRNQQVCRLVTFKRDLIFHGDQCPIPGCNENVETCYPIICLN